MILIIFMLIHLNLCSTKVFLELNIIKVFLKRPQKFAQSSSWFWHLLSKRQNHKEDGTNFFGILRKAELYLANKCFTFCKPCQPLCTHVFSSQVGFGRCFWLSISISTENYCVTYLISFLLFLPISFRRYRGSVCR